MVVDERAITRCVGAAEGSARSAVGAESAAARGARSTSGGASSAPGLGRLAASPRVDARATVGRSLRRTVSVESCSPAAAGTESPFGRVRLGSVFASCAGSVASPLDDGRSRVVSRRASRGASALFALASPFVRATGGDPVRVVLALGPGSSRPRLGRWGAVVEGVRTPRSDASVVRAVSTRRSRVARSPARARGGSSRAAPARSTAAPHQVRGLSEASRRTAGPARAAVAERARASTAARRSAATLRQAAGPVPADRHGSARRPVTATRRPPKVRAHLAARARPGRPACGPPPAPPRRARVARRR